MRRDSTERLPSRAEVGDDSLDDRYAIRHFYGKTLAEAEELFAEDSPLTYTEDLMWMEPVGFRFYIRAAIRYGLSDRATGDSDLINGLQSTLSHWQEFAPAALVPSARLLADFCSAVVEQFDRYDADPEIYTDLREDYQKLAETFTAVAATPGQLRRNR